MAELMEENSGYTLLYILPSVTENSEEAITARADLQRSVPEPVAGNRRKLATPSRTSPKPLPK